MSRPAAHERSSSYTTLNDLPKRQNDPDMLKLLRAKSAAYDWAQHLYRLQFVTLVVLPLVLAVWQRLSPSVSWIVGATGLLLILTDWWLIEPTQKRCKTLGAMFQELFDCTLFHLPLRRERNGLPPSAEIIHKWSARHPSVEGLQNWYSPLVETLPGPAATVVCQRTNGYWNSSMRTRYAETIKGSLAVLIVLVIAVTLSAEISTRSIVAAVGLCLPLLRWASNEMTQQKEASSTSQRVVERADRLWRRLVDGNDKPEAIQQESRELQNDIFDQRCRDQQIFKWVYSSWREADEQTMHVGVEALVQEYFGTTSIKETKSAGGPEELESRGNAVC